VARRGPHIAYFCMEYGLDESFPIYSGGLGVLAGDYIKSARDLDLPVVAVGLRWERGYCVQRLDAQGHPVDEFPEYDHEFLADTGVRVRVRVRGAEVPCAVLSTRRFGHVPLFLIEPVRTEDRWITRRLYEAGADVRVAQEMLLGIGGLRALNWLGFSISTYHFNEGHAVFAGVEMIAERMEAGRSFSEAWTDTRRHIVFTTHTPVRAGNEEHSLRELRRMGACLELSNTEMRALGGDPFNMTVAGLRLSRRANGVSQLHGRTARIMWTHVEDAAPIIAITNGVHRPTWQADPFRDAMAPAERLRAGHARFKEELLGEIRARTQVAFDPNLLLVGFARRSAGYKRSDLILGDPARLSRLLESQPIQFVFSGKAHPDDEAGKAIVARLARAQETYPGRFVYLENYDLALARRMIRGSDVWLHNPVRPLEACGTSGMKAALNGVLNLGIRDGWWDEACEHGVNGWAIDGEGPADDARDLGALYDTLAREVLPAWRDPARWLAMMRASIETAVSRFTSDRMVSEYFERLYGSGPGAGPGDPCT